MQTPTSTIRRVYFLGLGALGTMYASALQAYNKDLVRIIVDEKRKIQYEQEQVEVNGKPVEFQFITPESEVEKADLIIIAVKQHHLAEALPLMIPFMGKDTIILSLLNGISSEEIIARQVGAEHVLYAFGIQMDVLRIGRSIRYADMGYLVFGERNNQVSSRVEALKNLFDQAAIPYQVPSDILKAMWFKFMLNVAVNQVSAVMYAPFGVFRREPEARNLLILAAKEVQAIALKKEINLNDEDVEKALHIVSALNPDGKTSMLQDVEAQRETEVGIFAGEVIRQGNEQGVSTPVNEFLFNAIRLIEKRHA